MNCGPRSLFLFNLRPVELLFYIKQPSNLKKRCKSSSVKIADKKLVKLNRKVVNEQEERSRGMSVLSCLIDQSHLHLLICKRITVQLFNAAMHNNNNNNNNDDNNNNTATIAKRKKFDKNNSPFNYICAQDNSSMSFYSIMSTSGGHPSLQTYILHNWWLLQSNT